MTDKRVYHSVKDIKNSAGWSFDTISEKEFIELFGLNEKCTVSEDELMNFTKLIVGSKLLWDIMSKGIIVESPLTYRDSPVLLKTNIASNMVDWRKMVQGFGSLPHIEVCFKMEGKDRWNHFWGYPTWENLEVRNLMSVGYEIVNVEMSMLNNYFSNTFGVYVEMDLDRWKSNEWFWRTRCIKFSRMIFYTDKNGYTKSISTHNLASTIVNMDGTFMDRMQQPIKRVVDSIKKLD